MDGGRVWEYKEEFDFDHQGVLGFLGFSIGHRRRLYCEIRYSGKHVTRSVLSEYFVNNFSIFLFKVSAYEIYMKY